MNRRELQGLVLKGGWLYLEKGHGRRLWLCGTDLRPPCGCPMWLVADAAQRIAEFVLDLADAGHRDAHSPADSLDVAPLVVQEQVIEDLHGAVGQVRVVLRQAEVVVHADDLIRAQVTTVHKRLRERPADSGALGRPARKVLDRGPVRLTTG